MLVRVVSLGCKMATFAIRFARWEHQDGFQIVSTFKAGDTAFDLIKEMHLNMSEETHKICVIGHAAGAAECPTTLGKGYEVDVESSTPLGEILDSNLFTSAAQELRRNRRQWRQLTD